MGKMNFEGPLNGTCEALHGQLVTTVEKLGEMMGE